MGAAGETGQAAACREGPGRRGGCGRLCGKGKGPGRVLQRHRAGRAGSAAWRCPRQRPAVPAGIALIMWNALYTAEKAIIRWSLLAEACYFAVQFLGECPRAGRDEEEEDEGAKTAWEAGIHGGQGTGVFPASCLPFFFPVEWPLLWAAP